MSFNRTELHSIKTHLVASFKREERVFGKGSFDSLYERIIKKIERQERALKRESRKRIAK